MLTTEYENTFLSAKLSCASRGEGRNFGLTKPPRSPYSQLTSKVQADQTELFEPAIENKNVKMSIHFYEEDCMQM